MCEFPALAIDIGASSGRHILGHLEDGKLILQEIYRFPNGMKEQNGHKCWDTENLFGHILTGMKKCRELGAIPATVGIDTWGVDFVLLDKDGKKLGDAVGYRDNRTDGIDKEVLRLIPEQELYRRTGIQKSNINTIYQLMAVKTQTPELLQQAETMLMIPDYFNFLLTGVQSTEYTIASTTQLLNPYTREWDRELINMLGFPQKLFGKIRQPGTVLAPLSPEIAKEVGYNCHVIVTPSHDTASAVLAVPSSNTDSLYISSGTWSLMGTQLTAPLCTEECRKANLTNEGGYGGTVRFLKNIMGLWMIQSVRRELGDGVSFASLCEEAENAEISSLVEVNDNRFFAPDSMSESIWDYCRKTGQPVPETPGELARVI